MSNRYDYQELEKKALSANATAADIQALAEWFNQYGNDFWTGECFTIDSNHFLYPIYREVGEDEFEVDGWEIR